MPEVTCVGVLVADVVGKPIDALPPRGHLAEVNRIELHSGGCAANTGVALSRLGIGTAIIGKVGRDGFGDFLVRYGEQMGVDMSGVVRDESAATASTMVLVHSDGERTLLHYFGANATLELGDVDFQIVSRSKALHVAGSLIMPGLDGEPTAELLQRAREAGVVTSLDTVYDPRGRWLDALAPSLPHIDYLLPSFEEARMLAGGRKHPRDIARYLQSRGAHAVGIKLGADGAYFLSEEGEEIWAPALEVPVVDALGAGDAWAAGFLAGVARDLPLETCVRLGNGVGACCVTALGATTGIRSMAETTAMMEATPAGGSGGAGA